MPAEPGDATATHVADLIAATVVQHDSELVETRRDLHAHPELSWGETRTSDLVATRVEKAGWRVRLLPDVGVVAELGEDGPLVALRADMDALPVQDLTADPWRSTVDGVAHACGHDVHTTALLGAALSLAAVHEAGALPGRVRLLFQPAEEVMPGGALRLIGLGVLDEVKQIFALHCEPSRDVGRVGLRLGPITSAADRIEVRLSGRGGHTSRPHLTGDLTFALAKVVSDLPAVLSRRMDPRAGVSVVWGMIRAGAAPNVIPGSGMAAGTVRILDSEAWSECEPIIRDVVADIVRPYGLTAEVDYARGVPPVVNESDSLDVLRRASISVLGPAATEVTPQSLGGEDFGWYLDRIPGAMLRLGTRTPGGPTYDLHQGDLRVDERAIAIGAQILALTAFEALGQA